VFIKKHNKVLFV